MKGITRKERFKSVVQYFQENMPEAVTELKYTDPYELIVAVILSAQCTDKRVNLITPAFFKRFPTAESLASSTFNQVYELIKSCSYPNNKAKHLIGMARTLVHEFNNVVPPDVDLLQKLAGVGRKSANVIASVIYSMPVMPVDTHVFRVSERIGLTSNARTPLQAEKQLTQNFRRELITRAHHWLILHGRYICTARNPKCGQCGLTNICKYYNKRIKINKF
jgi:endonuclease-3